MAADATNAAPAAGAAPRGRGAAADPAQGSRVRRDTHVVEQSVTVDRSPGDLYRQWRDLAQLPRFMKHLQAVEMVDARRSRWKAKAPLGRTVEWEAEIVDDVEGERLAWRSLPGSQVFNAGAVRFTPAPGGRGTEVQVSFQYAPPAGKLGALAGKLFGEEPQQQVAGDLRRFKQMMEAGEIPTIEGQPTAKPPWRRPWTARKGIFR